MMSPPRAAGGEGTGDSLNGFFEDVLGLFTRSLGGVSGCRRPKGDVC